MKARRDFLLACLLISSVFCLRILATAQVSTVQIPVKIRVVIVDRDLNPKPVPKTRITVKQADSSTPARYETTTDFEGTAQLSIPPGKYRLISAHPTDFQGKSYNWDVEVTVTESQNAFDLSNDNASIAELAPAPVVDNLTAVYKKYRNSVVTVLAEYGPAKGTGFIIDSSGLILTNQHVVHSSQWIAVQVDESHRLPAVLLAADSEKDIAVLRINPAKVPDMSAVSLLPPGGDPAVEGERVFTIGSPLHQSKVMTTGIVSKVEKRVIISDININHGNSGGPLFNSQGVVIGITTFGDTTKQGGPGISGILRIEEARDVVMQAKAKISNTSAPSPEFLPNEPQDTYPLDSIKQSVQAGKFDLRPYIFGVGDYDVAVITPVLRYRHYNSEVRAARQKEKRNRKSQAAAADTFQPLDDLKGWEEYVGEYEPVIFIQASPKLKETFWSAFSRGMASSHGYVTGPASMHFKTDFYRMKLFCGSTEIQPLMPGNLNLWFRHYVQETKLQCQVYFEKQKIAQLLVVNETSADPGVPGVIPVPVDADHISICKLSSTGDLIYRRTKALVNECFGLDPRLLLIKVRRLKDDSAGIDGADVVIKLPTPISSVTERNGYAPFWIEHQYFGTRAEVEVRCPGFKTPLPRAILLSNAVLAGSHDFLGESVKDVSIDLEPDASEMVSDPLVSQMYWSGSTLHMRARTTGNNTQQTVRGHPLGDRGFHLGFAVTKQRQTYVGYLEALLAAELEERERNTIARRLKEARLPRLKTLEEFDFGKAPQVSPTQVQELAQGGYIERAEPVIFIGDCGTGKTHLLTGLCIAACRQKRRVRFATAAALVNELVEAKQQLQLRRVRLEKALRQRFEAADLVLFDFKFECRPTNIRAGQDERWGGYTASFKLAESERYDRLKTDLQKLRRESAVVGPGEQRVFTIDLSKYEYTKGKIATDFDYYKIYVYSPEMIAIEKIRAICQQMQEYPLSRTRSPRARDFFDIHSIVTATGIELSSPDNLQLVRDIFAAKDVSLELLPLIEQQREFHRPDWDSVKIAAKGEIETFDFYFDSVIKLALSLKPLWYK